MHEALMRTSVTLRMVYRQCSVHALLDSYSLSNSDPSLSTILDLCYAIYNILNYCILDDHLWLDKMNHDIYN